MKIAVAHIIYKDWETDMRDLKKRTVLLKDILDELSKSKKHTDLLVLPAGFIMTKKVSECDRAASKLINSLPKKHPALVFGIDCRRNGDGKRDVSSPPYFGYVLSQKNKKLIWNLRQQGTGHHCLIKPEKVAVEERIFSVNGSKAALTICGEMTSKVAVKGRMRVSQFLAEMNDVDLVVNIAHGDLKMSPPNITWFPAMKAARKPIVVAEHIGQKKAEKKGFNKSVKLGPDFSRRLKKPTSIRKNEYYLKLYELS